MRNFKFAINAGILAAAIGSAPSHAAVPRYKVEGIGDGTGIFEAGALNNLGQVVGTNFLAGGDTVPFVYQNGSLTRPDALRQLNLFRISAINDNGDLGGSYFKGPNFYPFVYRNGKLMDLAAGQGVGYGSVFSINQSGHAVGYFYNQQGGFRTFHFDGSGVQFEPFLDLTYVDINDQGVLVHTQGFTVDRGEYHVLPRLDGQHGANFLQAINNAGQVVGRSEGLNGAPTEAFVYSRGVMKTLGSLGGTYAYGLDINEKGWIVGEAQTAQGDLDAFFYRDGVMRNVEDLLRPADQGLWDFSGAVNVNERGQILVTLDRGGPSPFRSALLTPVPEAQSWALMLAGLGVVGAVAGRRRRTVPAPSGAA